MSGRVLVGRAAEIGALDRALDGLRNGRGGALHLVGEAGIGKTALLEHAGRHAGDGIDVRTASADDTDQRRSLACVSQLFPGIMDAGRHPIDAALDAVDAAPSARPMLLVADDVQWADGASLETLAALVRRAYELGILVVTAARPHPRSNEVRRYEGAVDRAGQRIELGALDAHSISDLVTAHAGAPPTDQLTADLASAGGNPFLIVEFLRALDSAGSIVVHDGSMELVGATGPPTELLGRLARDAFAASRDDTLLLRAAATIPGGFGPEELAAIVDRPTIDVLEELLRLTEAEIFNDRDGRLAFRHDLIRQAVVEATPPPVVRSLNRRAVNVLREAGAEPARIASCWLLAADATDPDDVAELIELGRELRSDHPYAAADVLSMVHDALGPDDPRLVEITIMLGWILVDLGQLDEVMSMIAELPDEAATRLDVRRLRGETLNLRGELSQKFEPLPDGFVIDDEIGDVDDEARSIVAELSLLELLAGRVDTATRLGDWLVDHDVSTCPEAEVYLSEMHTVLCGRSGHYEAGLVAAQRATRLVADHAHLQATRAQPTIMEATMLDCLGRGDEALQLMQSHRDDNGPRWSTPLLQLGTALSHYRRGDWDDSLAEVRAGLTTCEELGILFATAWPHALFVLIHTARGDVLTAGRWLDRARQELGQGSLGMEWLLYAAALHAEAEGDQGQALGILRFVVDTALEADAPAILLYLSTDTARLADGLGDGETLALVADNLSELSTRTSSPVVRAIDGWTTAWRHSDPTRIDDAAEVLEVCGRRGEWARAVHDAAVLYARVGRFAEARARATKAFRTYDTIGADQLHSRLRSELRAHGLSMRPRRAPERPSSGWDSLTDTERRVVGLVGRGLTNREIAEHLFVSRRTIESHLTRVYPKLGFPTRAGLIVELQKRRSADGM